MRIGSWHTRKVISRPPSRLGAIACGAALALLIGCSGSDDVATDIGAFCAQASANQDLIVNPPLGDEAQIQETIDFYRLMGQLGPLEIEDDWNQLADTMQTANELVPGDDTSEQLVAQTAYASELAAYNIATWVETNCGVSLPITTIVPHDGAIPDSPLSSYVPPTTSPNTTAPDGSEGTSPATDGAGG